MTGLHTLEIILRRPIKNIPNADTSQLRWLLLPNALPAEPLVAFTDEGGAGGPLEVGAGGSCELLFGALSVRTVLIQGCK